MKTIMRICMAAALVAVCTNAHANYFFPTDSTCYERKSRMEIDENGDTVTIFYYDPFDYGEIYDSHEGDGVSAALVIDDDSYPEAMSTTSYAVGKIDYEESVSLSGAKTIDIPIFTRQFVDGMPRATLSYNSQLADGEAGVGWSVGGLSAITLSPKSIYYDDIVKAPDVDLGANNAFSLDGQRLIAKNSGFGDEYETTSGRILVKKHVVNSTTVKYFTARRPDGSTATYGFPSNYSNRRTYPLTEMTTALGYKITYDYYFDESIGEYYVKSISYGGKNSSYAKIIFEYEDSPFSYPAYSCGVKVMRSAKLLKKIVSKSIAGGVESELRTYTLSHQAVNGKHRLVTLGCSADGEELKPLQFKYTYYSNSNKSMAKSHDWILTQYFNKEQVLVRGKFYTGNFNDGLVAYPNIPIYDIIGGKMEEFVYGSPYPSDQDMVIAPLLASISSTYTIKAGKGFQMLDATDCDGDGADEIIIVALDGLDNSKTKTRLRISTYEIGDTVPSWQRVISVSGVQTSGKAKSPSFHRYFINDFLGTGRRQLLCVAYELSSSGILESKSVALFDFASETVLFDIPQTGLGTNIGVGDFDGDGAADFFYMTKLCTVVKNITPTGFSDLSSTSDLVDAPGRETLVCDLNGDGLADFARSPRMSYETLYEGAIPVWALDECPSCGGLAPILDPGERCCRHCNYNIVTHEELHCRKCGAAIATPDVGATPSCDHCGHTYEGSLVTASHDYGDSWEVHLSKVGSFYKTSIPICKLRSGYNHMFVDINNDGLSDMVEISSISFQVFVNQGMSFPSDGRLPVFANRDGNILPLNTCAYSKMSNFATFSEGKVTSYTYSLNSNCEHLLTSLVDSYGLTSHNYYTHLSVDNSYVKPLTSTASYPYMEISSNEMVLYRNYETGSKYETYKYTGPVFHTLGLGFCGFEKIESNCSMTGKKIVKTFDPFSLGIPKSIITNESEATFVYDRNSDPDVPVIENPLMKQMISKRLDTGVTTSKLFTHDSFGNVKSISTTFQGTGTKPSIVETLNYSNTLSASAYFTGLKTEHVTARTLGTATSRTSENYEYSSSGLVTKHDKLYSGRYVERVTKEYDSHGNLTSETVTPYNSPLSYTVTRTYDASGLLLSETDKLEQTTTFSNHNKYGLPTKSTNSRGQSTTLVFDSFGNIISETTPLSTKTRTKGWSTEAGSIYAVTSNETGRPSSITYFDKYDREVRKSELRLDSLWMNVDKKYDTRGRLSHESLPYKTGACRYITHSYDTYDRPTRIAYPDGKESTWSYSEQSVTETTDGVSRTVTNSVEGKPLSVTDETGTMEYQYYSSGNIKKITHNASTTSFRYDALGRRSNITDSSGGTIRYIGVYSNEGLRNLTIANGDTVSELYTISGLLKERKVGNVVHKFEYDKYGRLYRTNSPSYSVNYGYDLQDRIRIESFANGTHSIQKTYQYSNNNISSITYRYGDNAKIVATLNYKYSNGHLKYISEGNTTYVQNLSENDMGLISSMKSMGVTSEFAYTPSGKPLSIRAYSPLAGDIQNFAYVFDEATGNLQSRTDIKRDITETFEYDEMNRLVSDNGKAITYSDYGNILSKQGTGVLAYGMASKPYTATEISVDEEDVYPVETQNCTYNAARRITSISQGIYKAVFSYGPDDNRVKTLEYKNDAISKLVLHFGPEVEILQKGQSITVNIFIGGTAETASVVKQWSAGNSISKVSVILRDYLGSITHVTNNLGKSLQEFSYDAWGALRDPSTHAILTTAPALELNRGYCGHEHLTNFGLINMNARLYDPYLGRFLSLDPYVQDPQSTQSLNRYAYCLNNPLKYTDPNGEIVFEFLFGFFKGVASWFNGGKWYNPFKFAWKNWENEFKLIGGLYKGNFRQVFTRFNWEIFQTILGFGFSKFRSIYENTFGDGVDIKYYKGSTFVVGGQDNGFRGMTLGSFINIWEYQKNGTKFDVTKNSEGKYILSGNFVSDYKHEYGHYLQSQMFGPLYMHVFALPSLITTICLDDNDDFYTEKFADYLGENFLIDF